jgi:hypothetical protein
MSLRVLFGQRRRDPPPQDAGIDDPCNRHCRAASSEQARGDLDRSGRQTFRDDQELIIDLVITVKNATTSGFTSCTASSGIHRNEDHYYQYDQAKRIQPEKHPSLCPVCKL